VGSCRRTINGDDVVVLCWIQAQNGVDDLNFVAQALDERWAQWTVNQTACQDCLGRWTTFTAEERARNFTRSVHTLFNIHGQWEEIKTFARLVRCSHGGQQ